MTAPKTGPLTPAELQSIWESAVDKGFSDPLKKAGEGNGFEVYTQAWAQAERVSQAIDETTQSMFVLPWSGQSGPPASGGAFATVTLSLSRIKLLTKTLVLIAGTFVDEQITDWGEDGGVQVLTGRRYQLLEDAVFVPGNPGPILVQAEAERIGTGYNNPQPATLTLIEQPGTKFTNDEGTVRGVLYPVPSTTLLTPSLLSRVFLDAIDEADAFVPQHVGQYVAFVTGANAGNIYRAITWLPPNLSTAPQTGGSLELSLDASIVSFEGDFSTVATFAVGETVQFFNGIAGTGYGVVLAVAMQGTSQVVAFRKLSGAAVTSIVGLSSGATATIDVILEDPNATAESLDAEWKILDWGLDWGLTCTNAASPSGGKHAMLDALGREKNIDRSPGEPDDAYRQRIAQLADVVSPNAIRRALNRVVPGLPWCFREAGQSNAPGFYYQLFSGPNGGGDFYDYDAIVVSGAQTGTFLEGEPVVQTNGTGILAMGNALVTSAAATTVPGPPGAPTLYGVAHIRGTFIAGTTPLVGQRSGATIVPTTITGGLLNANRWRVYFSYLTMRAYFYVGVPQLTDGEFGFSFDNYPTGAFDAAPYEDFFDGYPYLSARTYQAVYAAMEKVRAGGVDWELYIERGPCP